MLAEQSTVIAAQELRAYQGGFFRVLVSPEQTDGNFALVDFTLPKGSEPPRHVHGHEDETFYLLEGSVEFEIGNAIVLGKVGQAVFAPRTVAHQFRIQSEQARMLTLITPGDFVNFFREFSVSIDQEPITIQAPQGPPPTDVLDRLVARMTERFGVRFA
ncbi:cupin domain-containing protein [Spirosoma sp. SC4-14]|uniref:cupin domain-containing protein n=1 Tax=Spirosoma sp. SC4-14 TaxID=3128900 RepID=UPI0030D5A105